MRAPPPGTPSTPPHRTPATHSPSPAPRHPAATPPAVDATRSGRPKAHRTVVCRNSHGQWRTYGRFCQLRLSINGAALSSVDHASPDTVVAGGALLHEQVRSSNVRSVGYSQADRVLEVAFHSGALYRYDSVPADVHSALMAASSKGSFLARFVKGRYPYHRISG
ncbi:KTSC domain-containing protein [Streptomyces lycii]|uniref:KTSC domain-containing protein n=1 Tax=Streptomyces lycii TaxID=2654337 RepID=A0ABQ7FE59_9ACTN|nr:KTSC domain-containing protein [Streptomyces lycii]KAF4406101.1 KTSC domain-containing protein [Streptomyces lycii]